MEALIIGGTQFVGVHLTDALVARGHSVTHFNRGLTEAAPRQDVETIRGDRSSDLERVADRRWDAVIDTCGYTPVDVERSARHFADRTGRYLFISTISVYDQHQTTGPDERAALHTLPAGADPGIFDVNHYGALKALCEEVVRRTYQARSTILRPGLIAGPFDPTDRFTYWPLRIASGGTVLAPVNGDEPLQYIDARDLAEFAVHLIERRDRGTYNCATPRGALRFADLLDVCERLRRLRARIEWADAAFLLESGVAPWSDLPLWIPKDDPHRAIVHADSARAVASGLRNRPIEHTVRDVFAWAMKSEKRLGELKAGLTPARESELLAERQDRLTRTVK